MNGSSILIVISANSYENEKIKRFSTQFDFQLYKFRKLLLMWCGNYTNQEICINIMEWRMSYANNFLFTDDNFHHKKILYINICRWLQRPPSMGRNCRRLKSLHRIPSFRWTLSLLLKYNKYLYSFTNLTNFPSLLS